MEDKKSIIKGRKNEIIGIFLLGCAVFLLVSLISFNQYDLSWVQYPPQKPVKIIPGGGAHISGSLIYLFGLGSYIAVAILAVCGWGKFKEKMFSRTNLLGIVIMLLASCTLLSGVSVRSNIFYLGWGGLAGKFFNDTLTKYLSVFGTYIVITILFIISVLLTTNLSLLSLVKDERKIKDQKKKKKEDSVPAEIAAPVKIVPKSKPLITGMKEEEKKADVVQTEFEFMDELYKPPSTDLLLRSEGISDFSEEKLHEDAKKLVEILENFGIATSVTQISRGPVITRFEVQPSPGVKVSSIVSLSNDLALGLAVPSIRIEAPVPGKAVVGIEIPNKDPSVVRLRELLESASFRESKSHLSFCLGKDIGGASVVADLEDMPHLLIAGATGSGKSVFIYSLILNLLFRNGPSDLRFVFIDPKRVELSIFENIPHLVLPVIKDPKKAGSALKWLVREMENRYDTFLQKGVHNITDYNKGDAKLPYLVVVVDELADLMMVASFDIEDKLCRVAQMGRAVGIHLVLATQRPSVDIITGVIKANFPCRVSFAVSSSIDSRTILDLTGAEKLLGKGDMLFSQPGGVKPSRIQSAFVTREEVKKVVAYLKQQCGKPAYAAERLEEIARDDVPESEEDELFREALKIVVMHRQASTSLIQRKLKIGYNRAARIIDHMYEGGFIGPSDGSKARDVLIDETYLDKLKD